MMLDVAFCHWAFICTILFTSVILVSLTTIRYTSSSGERRISVHTAAAPVVTDLGEMYRQADTGAIVSVLARTG